MWVLRRTAVSLIGTVAAVALAAGACGGDAPDEPDGTVELDGTSWSDAAVDGFELAGTLEVTFADGSISVAGGCNTQTGAYHVDGDVLLAASLAATRKACPQELMAQDAWVADLLRSGVVVEVDGSTMTWSATDVTVTMQSR